MAMPSTVNPLALYFCCISISQGISTRQGSHQVAQKFTRTTFPLYSESERFFPSRSISVISGAAMRTVGLAARVTPPLCVCRVARSARYVAKITAITATIVSRGFFIPFLLGLAPVDSISQLGKSRKMRALFHAGQRFLQPQNDAVKK